MNKKITIVALVALMLLTAALPASAAIQATSVEIRGEVLDNATSRHVPNATGCFPATCEASWNAYNFAGFWYDLKNGLMSENMTIIDLSTDNRTIQQKGLWYNTTKQLVQYKVNEANTILTVEQALDTSGNKVSAGGNYSKIGWQAEPYVALNGKAKKLVKLIIEQGKATSEKKTLTIGETWDVGGGWILAAQSIDAKATPRQAWLVLSKDGVKKDDKVTAQGTVYTYVEKSLGGESDVPIFVTYIDSVFAGATSDMVQLRYTWAVDTSVTEVKGGDKFGVMKVNDAGDTTLKLWNEDSSISLSKDATTDIMGNVKFKVADSDTARFYPVVTRTTPGIHEVRGAVYDNSTSPYYPSTVCTQGPGCEASWNAYNFAGFWYDLKNGLMSENMTIIDLSTDNRTIQQKGLWYNTTKQLVQYKVNEANTILTVEQALDTSGNKVSAGGNYSKIGWQAEPYVALNGKAKKLVKLIIEQGKATSEKKTLTIGETWDVGGGWILAAQSIDAKATPRQAWLVLSKDGVKKDDKVTAQGTVYTYVEKSLGGESDVPIFVTYIDSVFAGATSDMVQLRYTWAVDTSVTEVKGGDKFGVMKVNDAGDTTLRLWNEDSSMSLSKDATTDIMGNMKFKVADSDTARFYPMVEYEIKGITPPGTPTATPGVGTPVGTPLKTPLANATVTTPEVNATTAVAAVTTAAAAATTKKTEPGFEAIFAIAGLLAVAFLVLRQRK